MTISDDERAVEIVSWHHDSAPLLVKDLVVAFAAVRAEATLAGAAAERQRIEAAVRCAPCLDGDGKVIATSVAIDAIRAGNP